MRFIEDVATATRKEDLELVPENYKDRNKIPGYFLECKDGNTYLLFGPDMDAVKHMHAYTKLFRMAKTYMSDHTYNPERLCFKPAFCKEKDIWGGYKVYCAPITEMGKIYLVE